jgi:hypothetical protein
MNLVLFSWCARSAQLLFLVVWLMLDRELKRAGGRAACSPARAPLRPKTDALPWKGVRGEGWMAKLFTMASCAIQLALAWQGLKQRPYGRLVVIFSYRYHEPSLAF